MLVAQKNHHTRFFQPGSDHNVPPGKCPKGNCLCSLGFTASEESIFLHQSRFMRDLLFAGTIIDSKICHPRNNDFYLCAHAGMIVSISNHLFNFFYRVLACCFYCCLILAFLLYCIWSVLFSWQGTTRPTHYHVLLDEVGYSADELQELVHSLSYV